MFHFFVHITFILACRNSAFAHPLCHGIRPELNVKYSQGCFLFFISFDNLRSHKLQTKRHNVKMVVPFSLSELLSYSHLSGVSGDKGDNEIGQQAEHRSPGTYHTAEKIPRIPHLGDHLKVMQPVALNPLPINMIGRIIIGKRGEGTKDLNYLLPFLNVEVKKFTVRNFITSTSLINQIPTKHMWRINLAICVICGQSPNCCQYSSI